MVCPKLSKPDNGALVPAACSLKDVEYGTRCVFYCHEGYELRGPRYTTCQSDRTWTETAPVSCVRGQYHRAKDNVLRELGCIPFDQSRSKIIFFIPFHRNPILDYNLNDPPPEADWSYWYLKLVWDCSFHLINRFIDRILDCVIT